MDKYVTDYMDNNEQSKKKVFGCFLFFVLRNLKLKDKWKRGNPFWRYVEFKIYLKIEEMKIIKPKESNLYETDLTFFIIENTYRERDLEVLEYKECV